MEMYDQLLLVLGYFQTSCWKADMSILPWAAIAMADYVRGITDAATFQAMMDLIGEVGDADYSSIGQCMVRIRG